jgi:formate hydrogenlyase subunit 4
MTAVAFEIAWLLLVLPAFDTVHRRIFRVLQANPTPKIRIVDWYWEFLRVLKKRPADDLEFYVALVRKGLLYTVLVLSIVTLTMFLNASYSPYLVLAIIFCLGIIRLLIGFTFEKNFIALGALDESAQRQGAVLVLLVGMMATWSVSWDISLREIVTMQMKPMVGMLPSFGIFFNPIAFICVSVALSLYLRHWEEEEFSPRAYMRKSAKHELFGIDLLAFKIARNMDHILLYSLVIFVFLGGPYLNDSEISPLTAIAIFSAKLSLVAFAVLGIRLVLPRMNNQSLRVMFLVLLPLEIISYPLTVGLRRLLNLH